MGKIIEVEDNPASTTAYYEKVDIGEPEIRSIGKYLVIQRLGLKG